MSISPGYDTDQRLRAVGFRLYSRPRTGEPVWTLNGVRYPESQALAMLPRLEWRAARAA